MRELTDDRGAVAVLTAVLTSAALIACVVISVDVGRLFGEHRQVRNGADAAALAVAQSCVRGLSTAPGDPCEHGTGPSSLAARVAGGNATDEVTAVERVCGTAPGLAACPTVAGGSSLSTCPEVPANGPPYVEVHTRAVDADGDETVDPVAAGGEGSVVRACARAGYGTPSTMVSALPITISRCLVEDYRNARGRFAPPPPYLPNSGAYASWETTVVLHQAGGACAKSAAGKNAPGNFGWLDTDDDLGPCSAQTAVGDRVGGDTGNGNPRTRGCSTSYLGSLLGRTVYVPVFDPDRTTGTGSNVEYLVVGYASFYFTGWKLSGSSHESVVTDSLPCRGSETCISGFFVRGLVPTPQGLSDAPDHGTSVAALLG